MPIVFKNTVKTGQTDLDHGISDLQVVSGPDGVAVYTASSIWGGLAGYTLTSHGSLRATDTLFVGPEAVKGQSLGLTQVNLPSGPALVIGGLGEMGLAQTAVDAQGNLGQLEKLSGPDDGKHTLGVHLGSALVMADPDGNGLTRYTISDGAVANPITHADGNSSFAHGIVDLDIGVQAGSPFVVTAATGNQGGDRIKPGETGVTVWSITGGGPKPVASYGADQGLGFMTPAGLATATVGGQVYVILASAPDQGQGGALSVMALGQDGALTPVDHVIDTQGTRFGNTTSLDCVTVGGQAFLVAGGGDAGVSLFTILPGGRLVHLDSFEDTFRAGLEKVSALGIAHQDSALHIFAGSQSEAGVSHLSFALPTRGSVQTATRTGTALSGGAAADICVGQDGADTVSGGGGNDILADGGGADRLTGGAGKDLFVLSGDGTSDTITDFDPSQDSLDLSDWPFFYDANALTISKTNDGARITWRDEVLILKSSHGGALNPEAVRATVMDTPHRITLSAPGTKLTGNAANNTLTAGWGQDTVAGHDGHDLLDGAEGDDLLIGGTGNDTLKGGSGDDTLRPGAGDDHVLGGPGTDRVVLGVAHGDATLEQLGPSRARITSSEGTDILESVDVIQFADKTLTWAQLFPETPVNPGQMLTGTSGKDLLSGGRGDDTLNGYQGADTLLGKAGHDRMMGGHGADTLRGGNGKDEIDGNQDGDLIFGGPGADTLKGGGGTDTLWGGDGHDLLLGQGEANLLTGGVGRDTLKGGNSADLLQGEKGHDRLFGYGGNDSLFGGKGKDTLSGHRGNDRLFGEEGNDRLFGGDGRDILEGGTGNDRLEGHQGGDLLKGDDGDDRLFGGGGSDKLFGHQGHDTLAGGDGDDSLIGGFGHDRLFGGAGSDYLRGDAGRDTFVFRPGAGRDEIADFDTALDVLELDARLLDGLTDPAHILDRFATVTAEGVEFDFGDGDILLLLGLTSLTDLLDGLLIS